MLTFRYFGRFIFAFVAKFKGLISLGVVVGIIFFLFASILGPVITGPKPQKIGITGRYRTDTLPNFLLGMISSGLTKVDENGNIMPGLASSWETPDKGKTWIFHLDQKTLWQDGKVVTSQNIIYEFTDVALEKPDDKTIIFKLQSPFSPFPSVVTKPVFRKGLLGVGEWKVEKVIVVENTVNELVITDKKKNKKVYKFYPTEEAARVAFKLGKVDILQDLDRLEELASWKRIKVEKEVNTDRFVAVFFNTQDKSLSEKSLRQALTYAINKEKFDFPKASGPISPTSWAYNPQVKPYNYDPERAKQLIKDLPDEAKKGLSFTLTTSSALLKEAELIAKDWETIGIKTKVQVVSGIPTEFQALLATFDIPKDPDQYSIWHSTQTGTNITHYQNPRIDKLLEDGRATVDLGERKRIYLDFQRFLVEDSPAAFLYHPISYTIKRK